MILKWQTLKRAESQHQLHYPTLHNLVRLDYHHLTPTRNLNYYVHYSTQHHSQKYSSVEWAIRVLTSKFQFRYLYWEAASFLPVLSHFCVFIFFFLSQYCSLLFNLLLSYTTYTFFNSYTQTRRLLSVIVNDFEAVWCRWWTMIPQCGKRTWHRQKLNKDHNLYLRTSCLCPDWNREEWPYSFCLGLRRTNTL
jgi:6-pyruvoyl-tetrahydropterin synthase